MGNLAYFEVNEKYLQERWAEVKEDVWEDLKLGQQRALKRLLESSMEIEVQDLMGTARWEHNLKRTNSRNGGYYRGLTTNVGYIANLRVPRVRTGGINFKVLEKYKQRAKDIDDMVRNMFLNGVSTRDVSRVLEPLLGKSSISATTVSNIAKELDKEVFKFHNKKLSDEYRYLIFDGIYLNAKSPVYKKRRCILVCHGLNAVGQKELIDFHLAKEGESETAWTLFLNMLHHRGLEGDILDAVVIDGNKGLYNAVQFIYPSAKIQRCWFHKLKNVANKCPKKIHEEVIKGARDIYSAEGRDKAIQAYKRWQEKWRNIVPKAVECLEEDLEELLTFYSLPREYWKKLRTTNAIERSFREVRRRTRPMSCFQNRASVERIIFAVFCKLNKSWKLRS